MARIKNPSSANSALDSRKRSRESTSPVRSPKRKADMTLNKDAPNLRSSFGRENSPSKNVHWGRGSRIISGPTVSDPERRSQSPTRSALRRPPRDDDEEEEHGTRYDDHQYGPSAQLQDDLCQAERAASPTRTSPKKNAYDPKKLPSSAGQLHVTPAFNTKLAKTQQAKAFAAASENGIDEHVCYRMDILRKMIAQLVTTFPCRSKKAKSDALSQLLVPENKLLIRYIGSIALSGENGAESWQELLTDEDARQKVIWGVVGRALKENVFDELYFGAWPELETKLASMERGQMQQDGFYRQCTRSEEIAKEEARTSPYRDSTCFKRAIVRVALGLEALLLPIWCLGDKATKSTWRDTGMRTVLTDLVYNAGETARLMRNTRDVIFYFPPTLKDEEFEPARMECLNLQHMIHSNPYDKQEFEGKDRPVLRKGLEGQRQAIVRVVCFPGVQAYRQGGGELARKQLSVERSGKDNDNAPLDIMQARRRTTKKNGEEYTGHEGVRSRIVAKGVVLLQWGQQRLLTKDAGTSVHMDAIKNGQMDKYFADTEGHVELYKLFEERTGTAPPAKTMQRSPSLIARSLNYILGTGGNVDPEGTEEELAAAPFKEMQKNREAEKRGSVKAPASPRSRKRPGNSR